VLVDGGKGQLGVAVAVLEELGLEDIPVAALAKRFEEVYRPGDPEPIRTANIRSGEECGAGQQALYGDALLSRLRDAFTDAWAAAGDGEGFTNPARDPRRRIDYVFVARVTPAQVAVLDSTVSDHLAVRADLVL